MPKVFTSKTQKLGEIGENIAVKFLMKHGFAILDRNFTRKYGELDIVAEKENKLHFIEVKSVSRNLAKLNNVSQDLSARAETQKHKGKEELDQYKPEDNMHPWKAKRMAKTIQVYLLNQNVPDEKEWQVDLLLVYLDTKIKKARIKVVNDIIL